MLARKMLLWSVLCALAILGALTVIEQPVSAVKETPHRANEENWMAVAPGLVEPRSGEVKVGSAVIARVDNVLVHATDKVLDRELLVQLDDQEARARVAAAEMRVAVLKRIRNEQAPAKGADRRKAEDAVADAEAALVAARDSFDRAASAKRRGNGSESDLSKQRGGWVGAQDILNQKRAELVKIDADAGTPLPTQSEGQLNIARSELWLANVEAEKLRIRAPIPGAVLQVKAKVGELATPSSLEPLIRLGDVSALQVRAEVDGRDIAVINLGQQVVIRANAFRGREFAGKVSAMAPIVQTGHLSSPESRDLSDLDVTEVLIDLTDPGPLMVGMRVDAYFQAANAATVGLR
jgi:HlyD family secretion protein